nr:hypothetical protein [Desulfobulbaceae bacterium]
MEEFNCQVVAEKRIGGFWVKRATWALFLALLIVLSSCSVMRDRYIFPSIPEFSGTKKDGLVVFQALSEDFFVNNEVGVHHVGDRQQKLKTMRGEVAKALQALITLRLTEKKHAVRVTDKNLWDLSIGDLGRQADNMTIIGGHIRVFILQASTITARVKTEYEFVVEVDCYIGKVGEKKVVKRTVRYVKEMLNISHSEKTMNALLDSFLEEAALQVAENIESYL